MVATDSPFVGENHTSNRPVMIRSEHVISHQVLPTAVGFCSYIVARTEGQASVDLFQTTPALSSEQGLLSFASNACTIRIYHLRSSYFIATRIFQNA